MVTSSLSGTVRSFLHDMMQGGRGCTFSEMASLAAARFGANAPTEDEIATFLCLAYAGKASLSRFKRDTAMAAWLLDRADTNSIDGLRAACRTAFGAARTPSQSAVAAYLYQHGRRRRADRWAPSGVNHEVFAWLTHNAPGRSHRELRELCVTRFTAARTPSRSSLSRMMLKFSGGRAKRHSRLDLDHMVADWLDEHALDLTLVELRKAAIAEFGRSRVPSRSAIHRHLLALPGKRLTRRHGKLNRDPDLRSWVDGHRHRYPVNRLLSECVAKFGADRAPSRSALYRYLGHS